MHIVLHTQYYPPEIGAPQARLSELADGLVKRGFQVTVLTAMPSYPTGKIFPGYGGLLRNEIKDGIKIIRTFVYPTQSARLIPRLFNYFSFVVSSLLGGVLFIRKADFLLTESPPLFLGIAGYILSRLKRVKWIFNVSDLWPESVVRLGAISEGFAYKLSMALEKFCYQKSWIITGQSKSILLNIVERFPDLQTYHLSNGVDTDLFTASDNHSETHQAFTKSNEVVLFYGGLHGLAQGLDQILIAAQRIKENQENRIRFVFVGDGPEKQSLVKLASDLKLENVTFLDPVEKHKMPGLISSADICLVPLKVYLPGAVPSKLYEAMASGRPVILIAEGEAAEIVKSTRSGVVVKPGDKDGLTQAILDLAKDEKRRQQYGNAGREAAKGFFDRSKIVDQFANFLNSMATIQSQ